MAIGTPFHVRAAKAVLAAAALLAPGAAAQEVPPDLSGAWQGATKGKGWGLDPGGIPDSAAGPFTAVFAQTGTDLAIALSPEGSPPVDLSGFAGAGGFWAVSGDPSAPMLLSGHPDGGATKAKGRVLAGDASRATDATWRATRTGGAPGLRAGEVRPADPPFAAKTAPSLDGVWTGTMSGKTWSLGAAGKPGGLRVPVTLAASAVGGDAALVLTVHWIEGEETFSLSGRTANGAFWAGNGDADEPLLLVGTVSGKPARPKLRATGIRAGPSDLAEVTLSLRRSAGAVRGVAAAGAPLAGIAVLLKDRNGDSVSAVTAEDGTYSLDAAGLDPPFLLRVDLPGGGSLYGVATEAGVANVHPIADLILRTWYEIQGLDLEAAFADLDSTTPVPTAVEVGLLESLVRRALRLWLADSGLDPDGFDLLRSPFAADGTGFDALLDGTTVAPDGSALSITDGTTTQDSTFACSTVSGSVTVDTTVSSAAGTSRSRDGTAVTAGGPREEAVAGALAVFRAFLDTVNARGEALTASDLAAFLEPDFLDEGLDRDLWAAENATFLRGLRAGTPALRSVTSFDEAAGTVALVMDVSFTGGGVTLVDKLDMVFRKTGTEWLLHGDRRLAGFLIGAQYRTDSYSWGTQGPRRRFSVEVTPLEGTLQSVAISGGGIFDATPVPKGPETRITRWKPTPTSEVEVRWDMFYVGADLQEFPAPGTEFQLTLTPVTGPPQVLTLVSGGTTTETVLVIQPTGHDLAANAHPGTPLTAQWTLPSTFAVERIEFSGTGRSASYAEDVEAAGLITPSTTLGTVTIPATISGEAVTVADFWLSFEGPNGESIVIVYGFD